MPRTFVCNEFSCELFSSGLCKECINCNSRKYYPECIKAQYFTIPENNKFQKFIIWLFRIKTSSWQELTIYGNDVDLIMVNDNNLIKFWQGVRR